MSARNNTAFNRRRFLRGVGASMAIPAFASLVPSRHAVAGSRNHSDGCSTAHGLYVDS